MVRQNSGGINSPSVPSMQVTPPASPALQKDWATWLKFPQPRVTRGFVLAGLGVAEQGCPAWGKVELQPIALSAPQRGALLQCFFGTGHNLGRCKITRVVLLWF